MTNLYAEIDNSPLLSFLFHPRRQHSDPPANAVDIEVPVEDGVAIVCRAYRGNAAKPWLIYFHGNGEVVSDYDGIAPLYTERGLNLLVVDYRGYGASSGKPTFKDMVDDAGILFKYLSEKLLSEGESGAFYIMGRSLGSVSALELASRYSDQLQGLIIESGFISVAGLIRHLGLPSPGDLNPLEDAYRRKTSEIKLPSLVIHGEHDRLVPLHHGKDLYESLGSGQKELVIIPRADHNDIMFVDSKKYIDAIENFLSA